MTTTTNYPTLDVETPYGTVQLVILDPDDPATSAFDAHHVARVHGLVTINGIDVTVSTVLHYWDNEAGTTTLREDYRVSWHRRADGSWPGHITDNQRGKLAKLWNAEVRIALEAHPELVIQAKRARLAQEVERAYGALEEASRALRPAMNVWATASEKLEAFEREHPESVPIEQEGAE